MLVTPTFQTTEAAALAYIREHLAADQALVAGRLDDARSGFEHCGELAPESSTIAYALACVAARSGDLDRAFAALEDARRLGFRDAALAEWDADLAALRGDARWQPLLAGFRILSEPAGFPSFPWLSRRVEPPSSDERGPHTTAADFSVTGRCVVVGNSQGRIQRLRESDGGFECDYATLDGSVWRIATHPSASEFVVLTVNGELSFFSTDDSRPRARGFAFPRESNSPQYPFRSFLEYSPDGSRVAVRDNVHRTSVWSSEGTRHFELERLEPDEWYVDLAWTADGAAIVRREGCELALYDSTNGAELYRFGTPSPIYCARFDPTGERLATGHDDATLRLWDARTFAPVGEVHIAPSTFDKERDVNSVAFTLDGSRLAYATCESIGIGVVESSTCAVLRAAEDGDGHWCEPVGLLLNRDASDVWYSMGCGGACVEGISLNGRARVPMLHGSTPRNNPSGRVAFASWYGVTCFDVARRHVLWAKPWTEGEELLQAESGHFGTIPLALSTLCIERYMRDHGREPLTDFAASLFDPKRVRASLAGVELVLWR
ncbi:MAG: WD40 repeat domain-containing protein [Planctomycetes bacterium]|nr:WD40 repeat domain-containing protein [Planctomycetota bacterium]